MACISRMTYDVNQLTTAGAVLFVFLFDLFIMLFRFKLMLLLPGFQKLFGDPAVSRHKTLQDFMENRQQRIEDGVPVLDLNFAQF